MAVKKICSPALGAARESKAEVVVRITADCPLSDPQSTDRVVLELLDHRANCDYAANNVKRTNG